MAISIRSRVEKLERKLRRPRPAVRVADMVRLVEQELLLLSPRCGGKDADAAAEILSVGSTSDGELQHLSDAGSALLCTLVETRYGSRSTEATG